MVVWIFICNIATNSIIIIVIIYMNKKEERKNNILTGAFKLFLNREYANVITADLEEATGVTRGAIYYKVKNKEGLYRAVIDKFVFDLMSAPSDRDISVSKETPFRDFLVSESELARERMDTLRKLNIDATSTQYLNLLISAGFHYDGFKDKCRDLERDISELWLTYYRRGIEAGELSNHADPQLVISMFRSLYYGDAFCLSITGGELDIDELKKKYSLLYNTIRT